MKAYPYPVQSDKYVRYINDLYVVIEDWSYGSKMLGIFNTKEEAFNSIK